MKLRQLITVAGFAALMTGIGAEAWLAYKADRGARRALARLETGKIERNRLRRLAPAPTAEYEQAVRARIEAANGALAALRAKFALAESGPAAAAPAMKPVDVYFEISSFVERLRAEATRARVSLRPDERFGFTAFAREGPQPGLAPAVTRQCGEVQQLLELLLNAQPSALLAVQRERPLTATERAQRLVSVAADASAAPISPAGRDGAAAVDFFILDRNLSLRRPGVADSDAFRLEFTGRTSTLRRFLNQLAESPVPLVVRSIGVEPLQAGTQGSSRLDNAPAVPVPVVLPRLSRFTVIVERLLLPLQEDRSES